MLRSFIPIRTWFVWRRDRLLTGPWPWFALLWAAWAVRLWQLDASDLTWDETATYFIAERPWLDILEYVRGAAREHPPLYYLLVHGWMGLAGASEYSLRFFSVGASMLGVALTARLARSLARRLGVTDRVKLTIYTLLPALALASAPLEVYYAREARMYTLNIIWAALSSLFFLPSLFDPKHPRPSQVTGLVLVNALGLFTQYHLALLIAAQFATLLLLRRWRALLAWSAAHGLFILAGLIWLVFSPALSQSLSASFGELETVWPTAKQLNRLLADMLFGVIRGVPQTLVYAWGLLIAVGLAMAWRRSRTAGTWLVVTCLLSTALVFFLPLPPRPRYLIFLLPFAALALGQLIFLAAKARPGTAILWGLGLSILVVSVQGVYGLPRTVQWIKSRYGQTIATVSANARPGDGVLFYGPWQTISYHYYRPQVFPPITYLPNHPVPPRLTREEAEPALHDLMANYERIWVIPAAVKDIDPARIALGWLNTHAYPVWETPDLSLYLSPLTDTVPGEPVEYAFGDHLRLTSLSTDATSVPAGENLRLTLNWVVSESLADDVKLAFALMDARGASWQKWIRVPGEWAAPPSTWEPGIGVTDRQGLIAPQGAPPGPYTLRLTVLDATTGEPFPAADAGGPLAGHSVDLFTFEITEPVNPPALADVDDFAGPFTFESVGEAESTLALVAYGLGGLRFQSGYPVPLRLHWLAPSEPLPELELRLQLWNRPRWAFFGQATPVATTTLSLAPGYPTANWTPGRLVSLSTALPIPVDAPPGRTELTLAVVGADGQPWKIEGDERLTLGTLTIEERPVLKELPPNLNPVQVDFGGQISLRGYRVDGEARPGGRLELNYAWYALRRPDKIYSVFNHLLTADGQKITQVDGWPKNPGLEDTAIVLTTQWRPGEFVPDRHILEIPADAPPGPYLLAVGLYDASTVQRLGAFQAGQPLPNDQWVITVDGSR